MPPRKDTPVETLVRTSILVNEKTDQDLRRLADAGRRPLSWEIRAALEAWVEEKKAAA
jgi:predicted transcriptional regulator